MKKISILLSCLGILSCVSACTYDDNGDGYRHGDGRPGASCETSSDCDSLKCVNFGKGNVCACKSENDTCSSASDVCTSMISADESKTEFFVCQKRTTTDLADKGEACAQHADCKSGLYCKDSKCADLLNLGDACASNQECKSSYCINQVCTDPAAKAEKGQPCSEVADCVTGLRCINNLCAERGGEQADCSVSDDCLVGFVCINNKCNVRGGENATCTVADDCQAGLICKNNKCTVPADEGEPCTTVNDCKDGLVCKDRKCVLLVDKGGKCETSENCKEGLYCKSGKCAEKLSIGAKCVEDTDCYSEHCSDEKCVVECNNELCVSKNGQDNLCVDNKCTPIVPCPDSNEQCFKALELHPNTNWNYGLIKDNMIDKNKDIYGNTFQFYFPAQEYQSSVDFCVRQIAFLAQFSNKDDASNFAGLDAPFMYMVPEELKAQPNVWFLNEENMIKYNNNNYECSNEDKELSGEEFYSKYEGSAIATVTDVFGNQDLSSVKYVRNMIDSLIKESSYKMSVDGTEITCHPFDITDPCCKFNERNIEALKKALIDAGEKPDDISLLMELGKNGGALGVFQAMLGMKSITCDEYTAMYSGFGYGFYKLLTKRYISARNTFNCLELALGVELPFTIEYKSSSLWKNNNFYFDINTAPSDIMNPTDMFLIKMAPTYSDSYDDILNFGQQTSYKDCKSSKAPVEVKNDNDEIEYICEDNDSVPYGSICLKASCYRHFYSKFDVETYDNALSENSLLKSGFNIIVDYNNSNSDQFSCSEKAVRTGMCTANGDGTKEGDGPLLSKDITTETHSSQSACSKEYFVYGETGDGYTPNEAGKNLSSNCKPMIAVEMPSFSVFVELKPEDLKGIEKTAE